MSRTLGRRPRRGLGRGQRAHGQATVGGAAFFSDASVLQPALVGAPTILFGPGAMERMHQVDEHVTSLTCTPRPAATAAPLVVGPVEVMLADYAAYLAR